MIVYLAHPIDLTATPSRLLGRVKETLRAEGHGWFDPETAWHLQDPSSDDSLRVVNGNISVLQSCDAVIATLDNISIGTPIEMYLAAESEIPVVLVAEHNVARSLLLRAMGVTVVDLPGLAEWLRGAREQV